MVNEFEVFKNNIRTVAKQEFNPLNSLIGTIVNYTSDMKYCDVEVRMKGGVHTFTNIPAHGYPVEGSSGVIHFHDGNINMPFCDCEYRMNPPDDILIESLTAHCYNWLDNGDFSFGAEGFTSEKGKDKIELFDDYFTNNGQGCVLPNIGSFIEFEVDLSECQTKYFKFQCFYRGLNYIKVECYNTKTGEVIQNLPKTMAHDYKIWASEYGRFGWSYNKEVYQYVTDELTLNKNIKIRLTNIKNEEISDNKFNSMMVDGLLVYSENGDNKYHNSRNDVIRSHNLNTQ